ADGGAESWWLEGGRGRCRPSRAARLLWAGAIAVLTFVLRNYFYQPDAVFWALFIVSPSTWLLDRLWSAQRFEWQAGTRSAALLEGN
ncbi:MAG: hypothetical protein F6K04_12710, partial [Leptolyngbya sp. SIO4C5]|nr:hypothetical protein [Leptolyngbya sp. SIO4C5]